MMSFGGDFVLGTASTTLLELGDTEADEYDRLVVAGILEVSGQLEIQLLDGFTPMIDNGFQIFDAMELLGTFPSMVLPDLLDNLSWDSSRIYTSGTLSVIPEPAPLPLLVEALHGDGGWCAREAICGPTSVPSGDNGGHQRC